MGREALPKTKTILDILDSLEYGEAIRVTFDRRVVSTVLWFFLQNKYSRRGIAPNGRRFRVVSEKGSLKRKDTWILRTN